MSHIYLNQRFFFSCLLCVRLLPKSLEALPPPPAAYYSRNKMSEGVILSGKQSSAKTIIPI